MRLFLYIIFFLFSYFAFPANIDSLKKALAAETDLNKKVELYSLICEGTEGKALLKIVNEFYEFSKKNGSEKGIALADDNLGYYYQDLQPDTAIYFYKEALAYYHKINDMHRAAIFYNHIGICYYVKGDLKNALDNYLKCSYETPPEDKSEKAAVLNNIGQIYGKLGQVEKALATYLQVIDVYKKIGNTEMAAAINENIGMMYVEKKQYDLAERYLLIALNGVPPGKLGYSQIIANLGLNYTLKGEPEKGKVYLQKAIVLLRQENNQLGLAFVLANLGITYSRLGKNDEAISYALKGYELSRQLGFLENIEKTSQCLCRAYEMKGDYKNALKYDRIYFKMRDSITSESVLKQLNELNIKYESNKKDYELLKQREEIDKKEILIQKQNVEAEKKRKFIFALALLGVFVLIIAILIFRAFKQKQKANEIISEQKALVEAQKHLVEEKQKEVMDSIHYAKRIQTALLASESYIERTINKLKGK